MVVLYEVLFVSTGFFAFLLSMIGALKPQLNVDNNVATFRRTLYAAAPVSRWKREASASELCIGSRAIIADRISKMDIETKKSFVDEIAFTGDNKTTLQMAWTGVDAERIIVITSERGNSTCYLSRESDMTFDNISSQLSDATVDTGLILQKHAFDPKMVYIVANKQFGTKSTIFISNDGGKNFTKVALTFLLMGGLVFHESQTNLVLAADRQTQVLYISTDKGFTWSKIKEDVVSFKWSTEQNSTDIFVITNSKRFAFFLDTHDNVLRKSSDLGKTWSQLYEQHVYSFGMGGKFLYASAYISESSSAERKLIVSTDAGKTWNHARLPTITPDRFYSIVDSSEGQIFLHVDDPGNTGQGTLYLSDATGIIFTKSLENHLYPNYEDLTDFYPVQSMRSVYIASQLAADSSIHTVISYNRGAEWQPISRPEGIPCTDETKGCYLQIHNLYSIKRGIRASPPLSVPNAVGIILVHGHIAESLQTTDPDVYVSSDGGYTWRFALTGPHHYQIADHGGLLVAVPADTDMPSVVKFSTDEGNCWITHNFTDGRTPIRFTGLLVEPGNKAMTVAIWGYTADHNWHTYIINFTTLIDRQCGQEDYEDWVAHIHNKDDGCLLGAKETFRRLKKDSRCYNGKAYKITKSVIRCSCTSDDFDCDYGYVRDTKTDRCVTDPSVKVQEIDICKNGHEESFVPVGYHKIPGDVCTAGFSPPETRIIDLRQVCSDDTIGPSVRHGIDDSIEQQLHQKLQEKKQENKITVVLVILTLACVVVVAVVLTIYARKIYKRTASYRYMSIRSGDVNVLNGRTAIYEDSSDDEDAAEANKCPTSVRVTQVSTSSMNKLSDTVDDDILQ